MMKFAGVDSGTLIDQSAPMPEHHALAGEQAELLYSEIDRLPRPFRLPVVLCYFEGLTPDEAADRLRCPAGTVRSRLARACDKLRRGLTRRGAVLSAAALAAALDSKAAWASISAPLCNMTARAAADFVAGKSTAGAISISAMAMAQEVLSSMLFHKMKLVTLTLLFFGAIASGAGFVGQALGRQAGKPDLRQIVAASDDVSAKPAPGRMFVIGRVLDPQAQTGGECRYHGLRGAEAAGAPNKRGLETRADRHGAERLEWPVPGRCPAYLVSAPSPRRRHRPGAGLWCRLGRS